MDPYDVLEIPKNSTLREVRIKYLCLAKKYHPDKSDEDTIKKFQEIEYAYRAITNPESLKGSKPPKSEKPPPRKPKTKPTRTPDPPPEPPRPKFKKGQNLDSFLDELMREGQKKTGKRKDKWS